MLLRCVASVQYQYNIADILIKRKNVDNRLAQKVGDTKRPREKNSQGERPGRDPSLRVLHH